MLALAAPIANLPCAIGLRIQFESVRKRALTKHGAVDGAVHVKVVRHTA